MSQVSSPARQKVREAVVEEMSMKSFSIFQHDVSTDGADILHVVAETADKRFLLCICFVAIFGQSLERTMQYEQQCCNKSGKVPHIVQCCVTYLRENGLHEEGLFR